DGALALWLVDQIAAADRIEISLGGGHAWQSRVPSTGTNGLDPLLSESGSDAILSHRSDPRAAAGKHQGERDSGHADEERRDECLDEADAGFSLRARYRHVPRVASPGGL